MFLCNIKWQKPNYVLIRVNWGTESYKTLSIWEKIIKRDLGGGNIETIRTDKTLGLSDPQASDLVSGDGNTSSAHGSDGGCK